MVSEWWEVYILSNQGFGHTHSLVGESLSEGSVVQVPDVLEQSSCQNPWEIPGEYFPQFSVYLFPFPFPSPTHCNLSSESYRSLQHVCTEPPLTPSPFTSFATKFMLFYSWTCSSLLSNHKLCPISFTVPFTQGHRLLDLSSVLVC